MAEKKAKRKLTAILSADVKGYSHLMQENDYLLTTIWYFDIFSPIYLMSNFDV